MKYRIVVERDLCSGFGSCVDLDPETFGLGSDGIVVAHLDATDPRRSGEGGPVLPDGSDPRLDESGAVLVRARLASTSSLSARGSPVRLAETLRSAGFDGGIVVAGDEPHAPYERPALSKEFLFGGGGAAELALRPDGFWEEQGIDLRPATPVERVNLGERTARFDGGVVRWRKLVLATRACARDPGPPGAGRGPSLRDPRRRDGTAAGRDPAPGSW